MLWRKKADRQNFQVLRCSFCNKLQDNVPRLIAGPKVFICDECVEVCNDIIADDRRFESQPGKKARERDDDGPLPWPNTIHCALCHVPISGDDGMIIGGNRGILCAECVSAVQAVSVSREG